MAYGRKRLSANALRKYTARAKRRRTNNATKVKFQAPTAKNQKKQIMSNARAINYLYKSCMPRKVYCDWQYFGQFDTVPDAAGGISRTWFAIPLINFPGWNACLRADQNVAVAASTYVARVQVNIRMALQLSNFAFVNLWVVTPRKDQNARNTPADISAGQDPILGIDYIESPSGSNLRLNSAIWKVHHCQYRTMTETTLGEAAPSPPFTAGNPSTTWGKSQINIPVKMKVRNPTSGTPWTQLSYMNMPYYHRYTLLCQVLQQAPQGTVQNRAARVDWDMLATTINAD